MIGQYDRGVKLVFILWALLMLVCLCIVPYHYDEAYSYYYFAGRGWFRTMTFYPLPNNHIFFNLVSGLFSLLPLDAVITTRLPSLFAAFVTVVYFLKLSRNYFSEKLSLFLTFLLASTYPFILYGIEGRGYGFLTCFCVLQLYAAHHLAGQYRFLWYRLLYFFAFTAGLYTVPSYLYFVLPVHVLLFVYVLRNKAGLNKAGGNKAGRIFLLDSTKASVVVLLLYWIIVNHNGFEVLLHPKDAVTPGYDQLMPALWQHLWDTWAWLTNSHIDLYAVWLLLLAPLADKVLYRRENSWLNMAVCVLLLSPPVLLLLHRVIPFVRTWTYLIVPIMLGAGFLLNVIGAVLARLPFYRRRERTCEDTAELRSVGQARGMTVDAGRAARAGGIAILFPTALAAMLLFNFFSFEKAHRRIFAIDYTIRDLFRRLRPEVAAARTVYYTRQSMEYYVAEQLLYKRERENPGRSLKISTEGAPAGQDILVLDPSLSVKEIPRLADYRLEGTFPGQFSIYTKKAGGVTSLPGD